MHINKFVYYLDQYNVLSPNHSKIYDEYTHEDNELSKYAFSIDTKVEKHLTNIYDTQPKHVILTGNAGDGKTRLCRRIHDRISRNEMHSWPNDGIVSVFYKGYEIVIVKDLSELSGNKINSILIDLDNCIKNNLKKFYLIAANEGKLTKSLSEDNALKDLKEEVQLRFANHLNNNNELEVINLQDVTSSVYAEKIINEWTSEKNWEQCNSCPLISECIIHHNYKKVNEVIIKTKIVEQYRMLDYLSEHITMREMLIHLAYTITGGLKCDDIFSKNIKIRDSHFHHVYYENFYGVSAENVTSEKIQALKTIKTMDPGKYSFSLIDDFIINGDISGNENLEKEHNRLIDDSIDLKRGYFKNQLNMYRDHNELVVYKEISLWINKIRRKLFFESISEILPVKKLLPFEYVKSYTNLFEDTNSSDNKKLLIMALNRAFSRKLINPDLNKNLYATNETLLIKNSFKRKELKLVIENIRKDIDHLPSKIRLEVEDVGEVSLQINLAVFEYLMRIMSGGTHNVLKNEVEILIDTFRNELMTIEVDVNDELEILKYDQSLGLFVEAELSLD